MAAQTLEQLVQEFETATAAPPSAQPPQSAPQEQVQQAEQARHQRDAAVAEHQHQRNVQARSPEQALAQAVRTFKSGDLAGESDTLVEGYLLSRARRDPAFNEAVSSGDARRADAALAGARRDYQAELSGNYIDSDTLRARASVREGVKESKEPPEFSALQLSRMSDAEYAAYTSKRTGQSASPYGASQYWSGDSRSVAANPWAAHDKPGAGAGPQSRAPSRMRPMLGRGR
jgi:hypothetical protein